MPALHPNINGNEVRRTGFSDLFRAFLREKPGAKIKNQTSMKGRDTRQANE